MEHHDGVTVLAVDGEIDMASAPALETAVAGVLADGPPALVVDLSGVHFIASAGLRILASTRDAFGASTSFAVVAQGTVARTIRLTEMLSLHETLGDALAAVKTPGGDPTSTAPT